MAEYTTNYDLYKPSRDDDIVIDESLTENFEKIDTEIKNRQDEIEDLSTKQSEDKDSLEQSISGVAGDLQNYRDTTDDTLDNLQTGVSGNADSIGTLQNSVSANADNIGTLQGNVSQNTSDISTLQTEINNLADEVPEVSKGIAVSDGDGSMELRRIHGMGATPTYAQAQEGSADAATAEISYIEVDSEGFNIHFKNPLPEGEDNITVIWKLEL